MLFLQGVTPRTLCGAIPGLPLEEARRIVGAVHRSRSPARRGAWGQAHHPRPGARLGDAPGPRRTGNARQPPRPVREVLSRGAGRGGGGIGPYPARETRAVFCLRQFPGRVRVALRVLRDRAARPGAKSRDMGNRGADPRRAAHARSSPRQRIHGVVFQGMGEPLANVENVIEAIRVACEPSGPAIDGRAITICTAGLPAGIRRIAREVPKVRLAVSIASPRQSVRSALCPSTMPTLCRRCSRPPPSTPSRTGWPRCGRSRCSMASTIRKRTRSPGGAAAEFRARTGSGPASASSSTIPQHAGHGRRVHAIFRQTGRSLSVGSQRPRFPVPQALQRWSRH